MIFTTRVNSYIGTTIVVPDEPCSTWASSRVLAGHYLASQKQVAMLMYCITSSNIFACTPCMQAHPCLYLCWHVAISVHELLQVCRDRLGSFGFIFADILLLTLSFHHETG